MTPIDTQPDLSSLRIRREQSGPTPGRPSRFWLFILGAVVLLGTAAFLLFRDSFSAPIEAELATVSRISRSQANAVLTASGYVVAKQKASVASKGTGRLEFLAVEEGDQVKGGQIIARLEDQDVLAALERARADLAVARADSDDAHRSLERQRTLFASNLSSRAELDAAESRFRRVQALILSAVASVRAAEVDLENTRIRAPFDGTVLTKDADVGEVVAPFASSSSSRGAVVTIAAMTSLEVEADVSESNIMRISVGQPCQITLDAYPDRQYPGFVHKIVPTADRAKATVLTRVRFRERDARVLPEMSAKVSFLQEGTATTGREDAPILTAPASSVVSRHGRDVVLLARGEMLTEIPVTTGERLGARVEIREGVTDQDQVVLRPTSEMMSGSRIRPRK
jgi:RND family efflux transporter MFP subunit